MAEKKIHSTHFSLEFFLEYNANMVPLKKKKNKPYDIFESLGSCTTELFLHGFSLQRYRYRCNFGITSMHTRESRMMHDVHLLFAYHLAL